MAAKLAEVKVTGVGVGVGVGAGGNLGSTSGRISTNTGNPSAAAPAIISGPNPDDTAVVSAKSKIETVDLPSTLVPSRLDHSESGRVTEGYPFGPQTSLKAKPGTPPAVVGACRGAILSAATPLGAVRVSAVSAGPLRQRRGALAAPIQVRITYARHGSIEVRQAKVSCRLDAFGSVTAVI